MKTSERTLYPSVNREILCLIKEFLLIISSGEFRLDSDEEVRTCSKVSCKPPAYIIAHPVLSLEYLAECGCRYAKVFG